jgi:hypothetical protein
VSSGIFQNFNIPRTVAYTNLEIGRAGMSKDYQEKLLDGTSQGSLRDNASV